MTTSEHGGGRVSLVGEAAIMPFFEFDWDGVDAFAIGTDAFGGSPEARGAVGGAFVALGAVLVGEEGRRFVHHGLDTYL